jgi:hypothetical protein
MNFGPAFHPGDTVSGVNKTKVDYLSSPYGNNPILNDARASKSAVPCLFRVFVYRDFTLKLVRNHEVRIDLIHEERQMVPLVGFISLW